MDNVATDTFFDEPSTGARALSVEAEHFSGHYGEIMDRLPVGLVVHHMHGMIYLNEAARRILGEQARVGAHLSDFGALVGERSMLELFKDAVAGCDSRGTLEISRPDGEHVIDLVIGRLSWPGVPAVQVVLQDVTERARLIASLERLATRDPLTGISNRRHFLELSGMLVQQAIRHKQPLAALLVDIDRFKRVNDTYGHAAGDAVIRAVTTRCQRALRKADVFGRLGGEEFAATLGQTTLEGAIALAERLRIAVAEAPVPWEQQQINVTVSVGVAALQEGEDIATTLCRSDRALYIAKRSGRNRVEFVPKPGADETMDSHG